MTVVKFFLDGKEVEAPAGQNLLQACLSLGAKLPYFCWHPALGAVGACRQCAVKHFKDDKDGQGRIEMACMMGVEEGLRISVEDAEAREFRAAVIEWLMTNHPHDCPVCDEGGECHLQDMTVMSGHDTREYRFQKRTHRDQYLGPFVHHEMNRCIACYRCVRFYRDYAGGRDFDVFGSRNEVYFGRDSDGVLENEFSGNLIEVCPTGVFTDKTFRRHFVRKWDLQTAPSVCTHCSLGCNILPGERDGILRRIRNRFNRQVNGFFLCDRGRFAYEWVNSDKRIRQVIHRGGPTLDALSAAREWVGAGEVIGVGSPRASLESNYALRALVGPDRFFLGLSEPELEMARLALEILKEGPAPSASLYDVETADSAFVLGEDVTNSAPRLALALRQAAQAIPRTRAEALKIPDWHDYAVREAMRDEKGPLFIASPYATKLDDAARAVYRAAPDDIARLGFAVAHELDGRSFAVGGATEELLRQAKDIAQGLMQGKRPVVVAGVAGGSKAILEAAAAVVRALHQRLPQTRLFLTLPESNTMGMVLIGGQGLEAARQTLRSAKASTAILLENDLYRRLPKSAADDFFRGVKHAIVIDCVETATTAKAEIILPAASYAESDGTLVNNEGRAQRFIRVFPAAAPTQPSWRWLLQLFPAGRPEIQAWTAFDTVTAATAAGVEALSAIKTVAPPAVFRVDGQKIPREPHRASGRTARHANLSVHEPKPPEDPDSPLAFSMEGNDQRPPAALIPRYWEPGWNSMQALWAGYEIQALSGADEDPDHRTAARLIQPAPTPSPRKSVAIPAAFAPREEECLAVPVFHHFGSDELSALAPGIAELTPAPYIAMNSEDARRFAPEIANEVAVKLPDETWRLKVKVVEGLPPGVVGLPAGLPGLGYVDLPCWVKLEPAHD